MAKPTKQYVADLILWSQRHNGQRKETRRAIVIHTDESAYNYATGQVRDTGWTSKRLAEYNAEGGRSGNRGSYHVGFDDAPSSTRQVNDIGGTWSVGNQGNNEAIHLCAAGATAYWTRAQWLAHPKLLNELAEGAAHSALFHGIPIRKIDHTQLRAGSWGICGHWDYSKAYGGSSHWDPGGYSDTAGGFPWDHFIDLVQKNADKKMGATAPATTKPQEETAVSSTTENRIDLIMQQLAGPGKAKTGLPTFAGWSPDSVLEAAHHNLKNGLGLTLVQQIALVLEAQEKQTAEAKIQREDIATLAGAVTGLTTAVSRMLTHIEKENQ